MHLDCLPDLHGLRALEPRRLPPYGALPGDRRGPAVLVLRHAAGVVAQEAGGCTLVTQPRHHGAPSTGDEMALDLTAMRSVDTNTLEWLGEPGDYHVRGCGRSDVSRLRRLAGKHGMGLRSSWDAGILTVTVEPKR